MKLKLLVGAVALAASSFVSATPVTVHYQLMDLYGNDILAPYGSGDLGSSALGGNAYVGSSVLASNPQNVTPYYAHFWIDAPSAPAGFHLSSVTWGVASNESAGGYVQFDNAGGTLNIQTASTFVNAGTGLDIAGAGDVTGAFYGHSVSAYNQKTGGSPLTFGANGIYYLLQGGVSGGATKTGGDSQDGFNLGTGQLDIYAALGSQNLNSASGNLANFINNYANVTVSADVTYAPNQTPEPTSLLLASLGLVGLVASRKARKA